MTNEHSDVLREQAEIEQAIRNLFAPEDEGLRHALAAAQEAGLPAIQISPVQGKLLQVLATACNARKILEIGSLAGYSGIWLARALPPGGRLISLEISPKHAEIIRSSFAYAGVGDRTEVRVGKALDLLPQVAGEGPFDLIFIDADKQSYPSYLEWSLKLSRPGSIIVADNCVRHGRVLRVEEEQQDEDTAGLTTYNRLVSSDPRLVSLALAVDDGHTDGFAISVVKA